jgi:hypothetical protein
MQWFSTFFPRGPLLLLIVLVDRHKHFMKSLFYFLLINNFRNCIIEIINVYDLFGVKLI